MSLIFLTMTVLAAGIYITLMLRLYFRQSRHLYNPSAEIVTTPAHHGLAYEEVIFQTSDGMKLHGWFVPKAGGRNVILYFHGNGGNISHRSKSLELFSRLGFSTFIFDYRGYGHSSGHPSEHGTYLDAEAAWRYLVAERGLSPDNVVFLGRSLGAAIATWLAVEHPPRALVIESTFTSLPDLAAAVFRYFPARYMTRYKYDVAHRLSRVSCPVLVVHSREDEVIPLHHGRRLYQMARGPKQFLEIEGPHHEGFLTSGQTYIEGLKRFFDTYVEGERSLGT